MLEIWSLIGMRFLAGLLGLPQKGLGVLKMETLLFISLVIIGIVIGRV